MAATLADCHRLQDDWLAWRAELRGQPAWTDAGHRWAVADDAHLLFPKQLDADAVRRGLARAQVLGARSAGAWLEADQDATVLTGLGFERGWAPWWMTGEIAALDLGGPDPRVELRTEPRPGDYTGEHAAYAEELALTRASPQRAWYAAAYVDGAFAGHCWSILDGTVAGVFDLAVWPPYRRRGLGRALTATVIRAAAEAGAADVVLNATSEGEPVYRSLGMTRIGDGRTWWRRLRRRLEDGEPSRTAFGAASHRAVHQELERGAIFRDPLAWTILGGDREAILARARDQEFRRPLRLFIAVRHAFAEERLATAVSRGTRQVVVLGAGLDTFAYRNPHAGVRVFEVDHPATGTWKQRRLAEAGIDVPEGVSYVGVDFETDDLRERLTSAGCDLGAPTFFSWLGVVPYLTREAIESTLRVVAAVPDGEVVFDYPSPSDGLSGEAQRLRADLRARTSRAGEPIRSAFASGELHAWLRELGFGELEDVGRVEMYPRFFRRSAPAGSDSDRGGHVIAARVSR